MAQLSAAPRVALAQCLLPSTETIRRTSMTTPASALAPRRPARLTASLAAAALALSGAAAAQTVTTPPSGGNQRATVVQQIGLVRVSIDYSSPHVHSPSGEDRKGKIWGG